MDSDAIVTRYLTRGGAGINRFRIETVPGHRNNMSLILDGPHSTRFDVGSGLPGSNTGLEAAGPTMRERLGESTRLDQIGHVVASHAHIDHSDDEVRKG